jgi:hypothetical protein
MATAPPEVCRLATRQHGVLSARQACALGMGRSTISSLVRRRHWSAVLAGVYVVETDGPKPWAERPFATRLAAAVLAHGEGVVALLSTAAMLHGLPASPRDDGTIHICLPLGVARHQQPGVRLYTRVLDEADVERCHVGPFDVRSTTVARTTADLLRSLPRFDAVALLDGLLHSGRLSYVDLELVRATLVGGRGAVAARRAVDECDGRAESPLETRVRLIAADAGMPPHELQLAVRDESGRLLGRADLAWFRPGRRTLLVEADGAAWHDAPVALYRDRRRANDLAATSAFDVLRFTWQDVARRAYVVATLRRHLTPR